MRIISGDLKGKRLKAPKGEILRPTSDRVKESIFNILGAAVEGSAVLDLFAGTGNLGIEALSRGATRVVFVEKGRQAMHLLQRNLSRCGMTDLSEIIPKDVQRAIGLLQRSGDSFDLILMDPPYAKGLVQKTLMALQFHPICQEDSVLVIEHDRREPLPSILKGWHLVRQRRIGDTLLSFLSPETISPSEEKKT
jgi:16S rRNA (guanine966-N2)-methyltransferase